jgi:hypothetical protein
MSYLPIPELSRPIGPKKGKKKTGNLMLDYYNEIVPQTPINLIQSKPTFLPNSIIGGQSMNEDSVQALVNHYQAIIDKQERDIRLMISREEDLSAENLLERKRIEMRAFDPEDLSRYLIFKAFNGELAGFEEDEVLKIDPEKLKLTGDRRKDNAKALGRDKALTELIDFYVKHDIEFDPTEDVESYDLGDLQDLGRANETTPQGNENEDY